MYAKLARSLLGFGTMYYFFVMQTLAKTHVDLKKKSVFFIIQFTNVQFILQCTQSWNIFPSLSSHWLLEALKLSWIKKTWRVFFKSCLSRLSAKKRCNCKKCDLPFFCAKIQLSLHATLLTQTWCSLPKLKRWSLFVGRGLENCKL